MFCPLFCLFVGINNMPPFLPSFMHTQHSHDAFYVNSANVWRGGGEKLLVCHEKGVAKYRKRCSSLRAGLRPRMAKYFRSGATLTEGPSHHQIHIKHEHKMAFVGGVLLITLSITLLILFVATYMRRSSLCVELFWRKIIEMYYLCGWSTVAQWLALLPHNEKFQRHAHFSLGFNLDCFLYHSPD